MKEKFINLLKQVRREGISDLIRFLETLDFFVAPASAAFHGNFKGGLVEHSLKVFEILQHKVKTCVVPIDAKSETLIIIALLHDICKTNIYKIDYRNNKNERGVWERIPYYTLEDELPLGHGEKSVMMVTDYIKLSLEEKFCIRWHMGFSEPKENYKFLGRAYTKYPLALLLSEADLEASHFFNV
jgi:hypothetical protein